MVPTPPSPADLPAFLRAVRRLRLRADGTCAALWALALLLALALALPLTASRVDSRLVAMSLTAVGAMAAALVLAGGVALGVWWPRRALRQPHQVARFVGLQRPELASDLLSCVELGDAAADARGAPSPALVQALADTTAARLAAVAPASLVSRRPARRAAAFVLGLAALHGALLVAAPGALALGWRTLLAPPRSPFGDARTVDAPLVADLQITLDAPAYARRPPTVLRGAAGDFRALPGTTVTIDATVPGAPTQVELIRQRTGDAALAPSVMTVGADGHARATFTLTDAGTYRFATVDGQRRRTVEERARTMDLEVDRAPEVQLVAPADVLDVTHLRQIELGYVVDDDLGLGEVALVWQVGAEDGRRPLPARPGPDKWPRHAEGKQVWDLADLTLPPGATVTYWLEARDNDDVGEPQVGVSRRYQLKVFSPREQHEQRLSELGELVELLLADLAERLPGLGDDVAVRAAALQRSRATVVAATALGAAFAQDPHAGHALRDAVAGVRERLDKLVAAEARLLDKAPRGADPTRGLLAKLAPGDAKLVAELETDVLLLADWLDRESVEGMLDVADEVAGNQRRLAELLAEAQRTGDPASLAAVTRQLRALEQSLAALAAQRRRLAEDVLDRFINPDAAKAQAEPVGCIAEVRELISAGKLAEAATKLTACQAQFAEVAGGLEQSLDGLRGDRFGDEQQGYDAVRAELEDLSQEQDDIAAEASRIFDRYAARVDSSARAQSASTAPKVSVLVERIRKRLAEAPGSGLTPFSTEELEIVDRRLDDVERMSGSGDLAEAQAMARQAETSLDTVAQELEAALEDEPTSRWADDTRRAGEVIERTLPLVRELIDLLGAATPAPDELLTADDRAALDRLRKRQAGNADRAGKLAERARASSGQLPGDAGDEVERGVGGAQAQMRSAEGRMKAVDPAGARQGARGAADALGKTRDRLRGAARNQQAGAGADNEQPIKIPGADAYRPPERFREDLLEAMKGAVPDGYDEQLRRYYEDLIR